MYTGPEPTAPRPPTVDGAFVPFETTLKFRSVLVPAAGVRLHSATKHMLVRAARLQAARLPDLGRITVRAVWTIADRRVTDVRRLNAVLEALIAGLLNAGVVQRRDQVVIGTNEISHDPREYPATIELHIERLP